MDAPAPLSLRWITLKYVLCSLQNPQWHWTPAVHSGNTEWRIIHLLLAVSLLQGSTGVSWAYLYAQLFRCVWLFATPWTVAHQVSLSVGLSHQEYWSGLLFTPPADLPTQVSNLHWQVDSLPLSHLGSSSGCLCSCPCSVVQFCLTPWDPMDSSLPGSSVHRIFQARILEQVAISYSRGSSQSRNQTPDSTVSCVGR